MELANGVVWVTGGSRGIGQGIARQLAGAGATVAVHYVRSAEAAEALCVEIGNGSKAFRADLALATEADHLFSAVVKAFGKVDLLVNNARIALPAPLSFQML